MKNERIEDHTKKRRKKSRRRSINSVPTIKFSEQLMYAQANDIPIDICGVAYTSKKPYEALRVMETGNYMVDYESNSMGQITAIHIDQVSGTNNHVSDYKSSSPIHN